MSVAHKLYRLAYISNYLWSNNKTLTKFGAAIFSHPSRWILIFGHILCHIIRIRIFRMLDSCEHRLDEEACCSAKVGAATHVASIGAACTTNRCRCQQCLNGILWRKKKQKRNIKCPVWHPLLAIECCHESWLATCPYRFPLIEPKAQ